MCLSPSNVWVELAPYFERGNIRTHFQMPVRCGVCWQCKQQRRNDYLGRQLCEAWASDAVASVTLTYAPRDDLADKIITPKHFQKFIRAIRKRGYVVRYFVAGEYGEEKGRAHFHANLFFRGSAMPWKGGRREWCETWVDSPGQHRGHIYVDWTGGRRALNYACKYLTKETGQSWFSMSKKPPLGADFFREKAAQNVLQEVFPRTFKYRPPGSDMVGFISGATRRNYLMDIYKGFRETKPDKIDHVNEFVYEALRKSARQIAERNAFYPHDFVEDFKNDIDKKRINVEKMAKVLRIAFADWHFYPEVNHG